MTKIHPTAVVEDDVKLGDGVVIGPHCVVGRGASIGPGTVLEAHVVIADRVTIGRGNHFYPNSTIGCCPQVLGLGTEEGIGGLTIGDRNMIRENVTIHPSRYEDAVTEIGNDNLLMINSHIGHDCIVHDNIVMSNCVQIGGHCHVMTGAWISGMAASHQFVTIGQWAFVAGLAGLNRDVPPFMTVSGHYPPKVRGVNKRGLTRAGLTEAQQECVHDAYKRLYRDGGVLVNNAKALAAEEGLDENVRAIVEAIIRSNEHRYGRYLESLRRE